MKPTVAYILSLGKDPRVEELWAIRLSRPSRYAATPSVSQAKKRHIARRQKGGVPA